MSIKNISIPFTQSNSFAIYAQANIYEQIKPKNLLGRSYILFQFKITTYYMSWNILYRYSEYLSFHNELAKLEIKGLPEFPPKIYFKLNKKNISERHKKLEEYLNKLFNLLDVIRYPLIIDFIKIPKEVIELYFENSQVGNTNKLQDLINSSMVNLNLNRNNNLLLKKKNKNEIETNINKNPSSDDKENKEFNYYENLLQLRSLRMTNSNLGKSNESNSQNLFVITEFLNNLNDNINNKIEIVHQFEVYLKNEKKGWPYFKQKEINILFNGYYMDKEEEKNEEENSKCIKGLLFHIGNVQNNILESQKCLEFLAKLLTFEFNPQNLDFIKEIKKIKIETILEMELDKHIMSYNSNIQIYSFIVLNAILDESTHFNQKITRILNNSIAEKKFTEWHSKL